VLHGQSRPGEAGQVVAGGGVAAERVRPRQLLLVPILSQHDQADTDSSARALYHHGADTVARFAQRRLQQRAGQGVRRTAAEGGTGGLTAQVRRAVHLTTPVPGAEELKKDVGFIEELKSG
jgi:hypothetical protein